jgi:predicted hydrocarbon binding protein/predicted CopG family antitoxin
MEDKYKVWFKRFSEVVENQLGKKKKEQILSGCKDYQKISSDQEMTKCVNEVMENFDSNVASKSKRKEVMEAMGNYCVKDILPSAEKIKGKSKDLVEMIDNLNELFGGEYFTLKGDKIYSELDKCFCHFGVKKTEEPISKTYCQCSLGYMKQLFSSLLDKSVKTELIHSILTGSDTCKFITYLD